MEYGPLPQLSKEEIQRLVSDPSFVEVFKTVLAIKDIPGIELRLLASTLVKLSPLDPALAGRLAERFVKIGKALPGNRWATWLALGWEFDEELKNCSGEVKEILVELRDHLDNALTQTDSED